MTTRQLKITAALLEELHTQDDHQIGETILHAGVNLRVNPTATLDEFNEALRHCDSNRWLISVRSNFKGLLWKLSDAGKAARLEMR